MSNAIERTREGWLRELTSIPTAAGHEEAVVAWIERWVAARRNLKLRRDRARNVFVTIDPPRRARTARRPLTPAPLYITAHLDHPAFVVSEVRGREVVLEFRGTVHEPYFHRASIEIHAGNGLVAGARIREIDAAARPFKRVVARLERGAPAPPAGAVGRWMFAEPVPRVTGGMLRTHACDDLAGVAAAISAFDILRRRRGASHVGLLFTRAEEVGFIGAIAACQQRSVPRNARLICLETSRSFAESPIGGGPIVRVGDRTSVFEPSLTNAVSLLMTEHEKAHPAFRWQRKLMPGGTCEATTFSAYGYRATCLCVPLGNYHNMMDIDRTLAGRRPARVGPEFISLADFHGLVEMLVVCATRLDAAGAPSLQARMEGLMKDYGTVLRDI